MRISARQYAQTLYEITDGKSKPEIEKTVRDFGLYLAKNRKLKLAEKIIEQFEKIFNQKNGIVEALVLTRKKLDEAELKKVKHFVKEKYGAKEAVLDNAIDENLLGGFVLKVEDEVMDGSVSGRLNQLKKIIGN